jgi:hypothetical protein
LLKFSSNKAVEEANQGLYFFVSNKLKNVHKII